MMGPGGVRPAAWSFPSGGWFDTVSHFAADSESLLGWSVVGKSCHMSKQSEPPFPDDSVEVFQTRALANPDVRYVVAPFDS